MNSWKNSWKDYVENILIAIFLAFVVRTFVITGYKVPTSSMSPTLVAGDFIFSYRIPFGIKIPFSDSKLFARSPERGDIVVFTYPEQPRVHYVKRVIALPGDRVEIKGGILYLNGVAFSYEKVEGQEVSDFFEIKKEKGPQSEWLLTLQKSSAGQNYGPLIVPPNELFLLGDNRDSSDDSRYWGTVPIPRVEGKVVYIWLSLDWKNKTMANLPKVRWHRVGISPH